jgi:mono/diheme cytochrome c family protein
MEVTLVRKLLLAGLLTWSMAGVADDEAPARPVNPFEGKKEVAEEGKGLFNQYCSHCHGPFAIQPERMRDLRRLTIRYDKDAIMTFWQTVQKGRMEKGMPVWGGVLPDEVLWKIFTYLQSIQTEE